MIFTNIQCIRISYDWEEISIFGNQVQTMWDELTGRNLEYHYKQFHGNLDFKESLIAVKGTPHGFLKQTDTTRDIYITH